MQHRTFIVIMPPLSARSGDSRAVCAREETAA
jgi:hypothetical protein